MRRTLSLPFCWSFLAVAIIALFPIASGHTYGSSNNFTDGDNSGNVTTIANVKDQKIRPEVTKFGNIILNGQEDVYPFSVRHTGQAVTILMGKRNGSLHPCIELRAPDGTTVASVNGSRGAEINLYRFDQLGIYKIVCKDLSGSGMGEYTLRMLMYFSKERGVSFNLDGVIDVGDLDTYRHSKIPLVILMAKKSGSLYPRLELRTNDGTIVDTAASDLSATIHSYHHAYSNKHAIICRDHYGDGMGEYVLSVVGLNSTGRLADNNSLDRTIDIGDLDAGQFRVRTPENVISVTIQMTKINGNLYPQVELIAPDGTILATGTDPSVATIEVQNLTQAGFYTIICRDRDGVGTGEYDVSWDIVR